MSGSRDQHAGTAVQVVRSRIQHSFATAFPQAGKANVISIVDDMSPDKSGRFVFQELL